MNRRGCVRDKTSRSIMCGNLTSTAAFIAFMILYYNLGLSSTVWGTRLVFSGLALVGVVTEAGEFYVFKSPDKEDISVCVNDQQTKPCTEKQLPDLFRPFSQQLRRHTFREYYKRNSVKCSFIHDYCICKLCMYVCVDNLDSFYYHSPFLFT